LSVDTKVLKRRATEKKADTEQTKADEAKRGADENGPPHVDSSSVADKADSVRPEQSKPEVNDAERAKATKDAPAASRPTVKLGSPAPKDVRRPLSAAGDTQPGDDYDSIRSVRDNHARNKLVNTYLILGIASLLIAISLSLPPSSTPAEREVLISQRYENVNLDARWTGLALILDHAGVAVFWLAGFALLGGARKAGRDAYWSWMVDMARAENPQHRALFQREVPGTNQVLKVESRER